MIPLSEPLMGEKEIEYVTDCIRSNWVSYLGQYVDLFESKFAEFCKSKYAIAASSGTAALHLALVAIGIGPGDEVIVPSLTFIATANAVTYTGACPIFLDSEAKTWNIDPKSIRQFIKENCDFDKENNLLNIKTRRRLKAIIPVHLYGHPAQMDEISEISKEFGLALIVDATESLGARYKDRPVGSIGDIECFSFNGNKLITTGGGGMLTTNNEELATATKFLSTQAKKQGLEFIHPSIGFNYRLTNVQAAIGVAQLEKIDYYIKKKREHADRYRILLEGIDGIIFKDEVAWAKSVFWLNCITVEDEYGMTKKELVNELRQSEIDSRPIFYPIHLQIPYIHLGTKKLPVAESLSEKALCLPSSVGLRDEDLEEVVSVIKSSAKG